MWTGEHCVLMVGFCLQERMKFTKLLMTMLPTVEPWVVPGDNVENPGGVDNVNPLDTLSSDLHPCPRLAARHPCPVVRL